jgi:Nucleotidyl transferase AbiEii toxin, Type IV TA system
MAEWTITAPSGRRTDLQMACFDRNREPVFMEGIGPVLHLEDVAGNKVWALADRVKVRDYVDTAALLARWTPAELIGFARRVEPDLPDRYLADAARRLDQMPDEAFMSTLRKRFAAWPRDARAVSRGEGGRAARQEREKPSHTRDQSRDLRVGSGDGRPGAERSQSQAAQKLGRRPPVGRERIRGEEPELGR